MRNWRTSPRHPEAAKAHLQATWNAAHAFGPQSSEYRALLDEHIKNWSESPTADDARMWLGRVLESERNWSEAAAAYRSVRAESKQFAAAVNGAVMCYDQLFAVEIVRRQQIRDREVLAEEAAKWCESLVYASDDTAGKIWPKELSVVQRVAVLAAARWRLRFTKSSPRDVAAFLEKVAALAGSAPPSGAATSSCYGLKRRRPRGRSIGRMRSLRRRSKRRRRMRTRRLFLRRQCGSCLLRWRRREI